MNVSKFASDTKLGRVADMLEGRTAILRDLQKLDKWASRNILKSKKSKRGVLHLRQNSPVQQYRLGIDWIESSFTDKDPKIFMDIKLNISQQCALVRNTNYVLQ